jgi:type II secretory pathway component GspD/PulD (secretin)
VPVVAVRETDTLVRVREGETVVISGLMRDRPAGRHKVPVLGDVPIFGPLFQFGERPGGKADLVILLTPTVLSAGGASGSGRRIGSGMPGEPGAGM